MSDPILTKAQQEYLARASAETMANLAFLLPPIMAQLRMLAVQSLPALSAAFKPLSDALQELDLKPNYLLEQIAAEQEARRESG